MHVWHLRTACSCSGLSWMDPSGHTCDRRDWKLLLIFGRGSSCGHTLTGSLFPGRTWIQFGEHKSPGRSKPLPSPLNVGDSWLTPTETPFTLRLIHCCTTWNLIQMIVMHIFLREKNPTSNRPSRRGSKLVLSLCSLKGPGCAQEERESLVA